MDIINHIRDRENKEIFVTFADLYKFFPGGQPDHFRPIRPVDLERMHKGK